MYSLRFMLDGSTELTIGSDDPEEFVKAYESFGGTRQFLSAHMRDAIGRLETNLALDAVGGEVIDDQGQETWDEGDGDPTSDAPADPPRGRAGGSASANARRSTRRNTQPTRDPWDDDQPPDNEPAEERSAPRGRQRSSGGNNRSRGEQQGQRGGGGTFTKRDDFGRQWTFNLAEAPDCDCGEPSARVKGKSQNNGRPYTMYRCAKGGPDGDWQNKCEFSEFPS